MKPFSNWKSRPTHAVRSMVMYGIGQLGSYVGQISEVLRIIWPRRKKWQVQLHFYIYIYIYFRCDIFFKYYEKIFYYLLMIISNFILNFFIFIYFIFNFFLFHPLKFDFYINFNYHFFFFYLFLNWIFLSIIYCHNS
jgi:hypothetical protein